MMSRPNRVAVLCLVAIAGSAVVLFSTVFDRGPNLELQSFAARGTIAAEETARVMGNRGRVVVVVEDFGENKMDWVDVQMRAFVRGLKKAGNIAILATETTHVPGLGMPLQRLFEVAQAYPETDAIVLFAPFPQLGGINIQELKANLPNLILVSNFAGPGFGYLLKERIVEFAILPRSDPVSNTDRPRTVREWFDREYVIYTAATAHEIPY